ncbi:MAG: hypothetical protein AB7O28_08965 [Vicinamibacterales bacterium]
MIRPLRRAHFAVAVLLALALPALVVLAVALREPAPVLEHWPAGLER